MKCLDGQGSLEFWLWFVELKLDGERRKGEETIGF